MFVPNQWLGKTYKIYCRSAQQCTRSTAQALDTRSTVLKFQNNRASKFQKRCSCASCAYILRKVAEFVKSDRNAPIPFIDKSKKILTEVNFNTLITVFSAMMLLPGAQKQSCSPVRSSAKGTLSPSSTTSSGHHVKTTVRIAHGVQGLSAFTTVIRPNFSLQIHRLALSNHIVKPA